MDTTKTLSPKRSDWIKFSVVMLVFMIGMVIMMINHIHTGSMRAWVWRWNT